MVHYQQLIDLFVFVIGRAEDRSCVLGDCKAKHSKQSFVLAGFNLARGSRNFLRGVICAELAKVI